MITAGAVTPAVIGVAALSSQTAGAGQVGDISPRPLLLMYGTSDEVLPDACSRGLYQRAGEPRRLLLYENCRHGLDDCRDEIDYDLLAWIRAVVCRVPLRQMRPVRDVRLHLIPLIAVLFLLSRFAKRWWAVTGR